MSVQMHRLGCGLRIIIALTCWSIFQALFVTAVAHDQSSITRDHATTGRISGTSSVRGGESQPANGPSSSSSSSGPTTTYMANVFSLLDRGQGPPPSSLSWLVGDDAAPYSAVLFGEDPTQSPLFRMSHPSQDDNLMTVLGLLSDVIVVALPSSEDGRNLALLDELAERLQEIADARHVRGIPKGRLVIVSESAVDSEWVEEVVQRRLLSVTPALWETFDVMTPSMLKRQWQSVLDDARTFASLLPYQDNAEAFVMLVKQAYLAIGGNETNLDLHLEPATPSKMKSSEKESKSVVDTNEDPQDRIQRVLAEAQGKLAVLENKMQELQLNTQSPNQMPLLDFGQQANSILEEAYGALEQFPPIARTGFLSRIVIEIHRLYKDQLQSLRDYYGRRYEISLDQNEDEATWAAEVEHMTQGFQTAAQHAVPLLCRDGSPLSSIVPFASLVVFRGLVQDMTEATQLRKDEQSAAFDEDDLTDLAPKRRRIPPWAKKIASRAIALGFNYIQGWLAWQGVKRAALERDREMPKFPLF